MPHSLYKLSIQGVYEYDNSWNVIITGQPVLYFYVCFYLCTFAFYKVLGKKIENEECNFKFCKISVQLIVKFNTEISTYGGRPLHGHCPFYGRMEYILNVSFQPIWRINETMAKFQTMQIWWRAALAVLDSCPEFVKTRVKCVQQKRSSMQLRWKCFQNKFYILSFLSFNKLWHNVYIIFKNLYPNASF